MLSHLGIRGHNFSKWPHAMGTFLHATTSKSHTHTPGLEMSHSVNLNSCGFLEFVLQKSWAGLPP